jgi:hypothetical protein
MIEHNPPSSADSAQPPVIPLPVALYVSGELILSSMTGDNPAVDFRSVGRGSFQRKKTSQKQPSRVPQPAYAATKIGARVHDRPNADFYLISNQ